MDAGLTPRIFTVVASVLGVPREALSDASSLDSIEGWDSLVHIQLIVGLEAEFGVSFGIEQALELTSIPAIEAALRPQNQHTSEWP
jgi:acyl carrier protein